MVLKLVLNWLGCFFNFGTGFETGIELVRIVFWGLG